MKQMWYSSVEVLLPLLPKAAERPESAAPPPQSLSSGRGSPRHLREGHLPGGSEEGAVGEAPHCPGLASCGGTWRLGLGTQRWLEGDVRGGPVVFSLSFS